MKDEKDVNSIGKGSTTKKIRKLQRQYEKILVDLFDQFAAESIEEALDKNEGSFGENIQSIVQCALDCLKGKVMQELGVSSDAGGEAGGAVGAIMGGMGLGGMSLQDGMGSMDSENSSEEDEEGESDEHEDSESSEHESGEEEEEEEDDEEDDETVEEKAPTGKKAVHNESDESVVRDRVISSSRRNDQVSLTEAYASMYKEASVFGQEKGMPRYGGAKLNFASDTDRALFIVSGPNISKAHTQYLEAVKTAGILDVDQKGQELRAHIKALMNGDFNTPRVVDVPAKNK